MKLALVTDLHANREAVTAVLDHARAQGAQRHAFLGDFVGYGADPGWVIDTVREQVGHGAIAILGNHDAAALHGPQPTMIDDARDAVLWTRKQLTASQLAFLAELPMSVVENDTLFVHASAFEPPEWHYITGSGEATRSLQATDRRHTFCGHMHNPQLYHLDSSGHAIACAVPPGVPLLLADAVRWLAIPGSAGQPRDRDPAACYAIFDTVSAILTFHRVPYDMVTASAKVLAAGLPQRLAMRLLDGS